jgi:hypothetical protein
MAKEFQQFNRKYAKLAGTALKFITSVGGQIPQEDIDDLDQWDSTEYPFTEDYSHEKVRYCVYEAPDADNWQMFRVSLKGLNTKEKLYALSWWIVNASTIAHERLATNPARDLVRVNNYLGALKRSGHLDANLKVAKL